MLGNFSINDAWMYFGFDMIENLISTDSCFLKFFLLAFELVYKFTLRFRYRNIVFIE